MKKIKNKKNKAFTLIELLAVIVVLSIVMMIGAMVVPAIIKRAKEKSFALDAVSYMKTAVAQVVTDEDNEDASIYTLDELGNQKQNYTGFVFVINDTPSIFLYDSTNKFMIGSINESQMNTIRKESIISSNVSTNNTIPELINYNNGDSYEIMINNSENSEEMILCEMSGNEIFCMKPILDSDGNEINDGLFYPGRPIVDSESSEKYTMVVSYDNGLVNLENGNSYTPASFVNCEDYGLVVGSCESLGA